MPNASAARPLTKHRFLMLGDTGSGKTTGFLTLEGKKFSYLFDPNALLSLQGHDVDYEEWLPDRLNMAASSLTKGKGDKSSGAGTSDLYQQWEQDFNKKVDENFFEPYEWIGFDSATTFLDLVMDRVLTINGRFGQWPQQDDYGPQMMTFINVCRTLTGMGKGLYMTGHLDVRKDELTQRIFRKPMMTGRLTTKIPLLFSDVFVCEAEGTDKGATYKIQTVPDRMTTCVRTSIKGLNPFEDVTVQWKDKDGKPLSPVGQGLGGILNWESKQ